MLRWFAVVAIFFGGMVQVAAEENCFFCAVAHKEKAAHRIVAESEDCFAFADQFPVAPGHTLIVPKKHTENWFTASEETRTHMLLLLEKIKLDLDQKYHPDGYNIGMNCGKAAGQSVMHLHLHLIPRYTGDMEDPKGGVRGVIPSKQKY